MYYLKNQNGQKKTIELNYYEKSNDLSLNKITEISNKIVPSIIVQTLLTYIHPLNVKWEYQEYCYHDKEHLSAAMDSFFKLNIFVNKY